MTTRLQEPCGWPLLFAGMQLFEHITWVSGCSSWPLLRVCQLDGVGGWATPPAAHKPKVSGVGHPVPLRLGSVWLKLNVDFWIAISIDRPQNL